MVPKTDTTMRNWPLILPLTVFIIRTTNGFYTPTPLTRTNHAIKSPSHNIIDRLDRTCLSQGPFKIRMPWDPPESQLQEERVRGQETAERKPRQKRQPRRSASYDLYGGSLMDGDKGQQLQDDVDVDDEVDDENDDHEHDHYGNILTTTILVTVIVDVIVILLIL